MAPRLMSSTIRSRDGSDRPVNSLMLYVARTPNYNEENSFSSKSSHLFGFVAYK